MSCCIKGVAWEDSLAFLNIAWVQALQGFGCWARKGRRACNYVSEIWIVPPIPLLLPIDRAVRFLPISTKWKQARMRIVIENTRKITNVIFANQHFASTRCRYSNSRNIVAGSPSFSLPVVKRPRELARRLFSIPLLVSLPNDIWGTLVQIFHTDDISLPRTWALLG